MTAPGLANGFDGGVAGITQAVSDLQFEDDDEEAFYMKDLPKHACLYVARWWRAVLSGV